MEFTKYHGTGNDFLIVRSAELCGAKPEDLAREVCARTTGIGADGLLICGEDPLTMTIINSDGSHAPMCGNGIRCFASYCIDEGIVNSDIFPIGTCAGEMIAAVLNRDPFLCEIDMGRPDWAPAAAGILDTTEDNFVEKQIMLPDGERIRVSSLLMGTFHTVVWLDDTENADAGAPDIHDEEALEAFGRTLHELPVFTQKTNVNMAVITGKDEITLRTYERGAGMTAACGTGACAAAVVAKRQGKVQGNKVTVKLLLGDLIVRVEDDETVFMAGPAVRIASGVYEYRG
ncbi:MAG: diaminopimelate epimerase [Clostridiales Family XIII bacterium]|jgi:diaminopimelate epimerase|nr:diaminopimelate epimerase [Clostridiales Family XIII bacterium]